MALITLKQLLDDASENDYAVPAFNISNMEQILAVMAAADATDSPVILQASKSARTYASDVMLSHMIRAAIELFPHIPICLHQDHGNSPATCLSAISHGFSSVMMDGSLKADGRTPTSFEENTAVTAEVVKIAHQVGVSVEGELGHLGSLETGKGEAEDGHGFEGALSRDQLLTDPGEARKFVDLTNVDALAVAIGTSHGAYKFSRQPDGDILAIDRLREINAAIPNTPLVMHGASTVPQDLQNLVNTHGGQIAPTWGVPVEEIQRGIRFGVRKVNVDTDLRMALTGAIRKAFSDAPESFDPRSFLQQGRNEIRKVCEIRFEAFGTAGRASQLRSIPLASMAQMYAA